MEQSHNSSQDEHFMQLALGQAKEAFGLGEVPVGAVIVKNSQILSVGYNTREIAQDPTAHAEMTAIRLASSELGTWRLNDMTLYVTLEPCAMCAAAISNARLARLYYGASDAKSGGVAQGARVFSHPQCHHRPEIYDGIIEIKAVARDPGSRAKIAVISNDGSIDPVGACVGMRGSRVQAVVNELQGEKIDIIPWNDDQPTFLVNALQPAEVSKVVLDEEAGKIEVVVPDEQLSLAIGRRGQNVRLASQLTSLDIDIMTEEEESARRQKEFEARTGLFMETLDLDEFFAQLLVSEGFTNLEEVAYVELDELLVIDGVDDGTAQELQARARDYLEAQAKAALDNARSLGAEDSLIDFEGLTPQMVEALAKDDVKTVDDFATCADWELAGGWTTANGERVKDEGILEPFGMSLEEAQKLVMTARIMLGWVDPAELEADAEDPEEEVEGDVEA